MDVYRLLSEANMFFICSPLKSKTYMLLPPQLSELLQQVTTAISYPEGHRYVVTYHSGPGKPFLHVYRIDGIEDANIDVERIYLVYYHHDKLNTLNKFKEEVPEFVRSIIRGVLIKSGIYGDNPPYKKLKGF